MTKFIVMNEAYQTGISVKEEPVSADSRSLIIDASSVDNAVLQRLIKEVQSEVTNHPHAYNRAHNRHNRGR
jgi:hypothetical protein